MRSSAVHFRQHTGVVYSSEEGLNAYSKNNMFSRSRKCVDDLTPLHQALLQDSKNRRDSMGNSGFKQELLLSHSRNRFDCKLHEGTAGGTDQSWQSPLLIKTCRRRPPRYAFTRPVHMAVILSLSEDKCILLHEVNFKTDRRS